ncbi:MAG: ABC transporter permease [Treponema sp.]|jgi:ABC-2 type transport system permease protein|nr:ABC transporter permease [Treponema sp.]
MFAILKREWGAYFFTPLGAVFIAAYYVFIGFFFFNYNLYGNSTDLRGLFDVLFTVTLFLIPVLTMRLMSEDRKLKTDQILLMAPVSSGAVAAGKYLAALSVYLVAIAETLIAALIVEISGDPEWPLVFGHFAGLFLLGSALTAIGLFISTLTENQIIAAIGGFIFGFLMMLLDTIAGIFPANSAAALLRGMSFRLRYHPFTLGLIRVDNCVFFLSVAFFFVFCAAKTFEKRRWA